MRVCSFILAVIITVQSTALAQTTGNTVFDQLVGSSMPDNIDDLMSKIQDKHVDPDAPVFTRVESVPGVGSPGNDSKVLPGSPAAAQIAKPIAATKKGDDPGLVPPGGTPFQNSDFNNEDDFRPTIQNSVSSARFPFSRSLQGPFTSLDQPRKVFSIRARDSDDPASFVGYSPMSKQAEVISWNPSVGRYEFKIIEGLDKGGKPIYKDADRSLCVKCHQNEGPIFPKFPWSESDFNDKLSGRMDKDQKGRRQQGQLFGIDADVRQANKKMQERKICLELCPEGDLRCKKALIVGSLMQNKNLHPIRLSFNSTPISTTIPKFDPDKVDDITGKDNNPGSFRFIGNSETFVPDSRMQDIARNALKGRDFAYPSSMIPDRSVDVNDPTQSRTVVAKFDDLDAARRDLASGFDPNGNFIPRAKNIAELNSIKGYLTYSEENPTSDLRNQPGVTGVVYSGVKFSEPSSPAFIRPKVGQMTAVDVAKNLPSIGAACVFPPKDLAKFKSATFAQIEAALFSDKADALIKGKIDWEKLDDLIANTRAPAGATKPGDCNFGPAQDVSAINAATLALQKVAAKNSAMFTAVQREQAHILLQKYCADCHDKGQSMDLGIDFSKMQSFKDYVTAPGLSEEGKPLYKKIEKEMPPKGAPAPTDEERKLMIGVLSH